MRISTLALVTLCAALLSGVAVGETVGDAPIKTTVCALVKEPARFNGKVVQVRAQIGSSDEASALFDERCSALIMFAVDSGSSRHDATDSNLRALAASLKKYPLVIATVTGRFDHAPARGFGHQNMFDCRLMTQSVSDVFAKRIDRSVYREGAIKGAVVDRTGAFIVNANVKLYRRGQKNAIRDTHTEATGTFYFPAVEPDTYELLFEAPGFRLQRIKHVSVANASAVDLPPVKLKSLGIVLDNPSGK